MIPDHAGPVTCWAARQDPLGSETADGQFSKQVLLASSMVGLEPMSNGVCRPLDRPLKKNKEFPEQVESLETVKMPFFRKERVREITRE